MSMHPSLVEYDRCIDEEEAFRALQNEECRQILQSAREGWLTAAGLAERCEIPQSTLYRKVKQLTKANLLEDRIAIHHSGHHRTEYRCWFEHIQCSLSQTGFEVTVVPST